MNGTTLEVRGVGYVTDGAVLLEDIDLSAESGQILGIVGPNGAGKSTLLRIMAGELSPTTGEVLLGERNVATIRPRRLALQRAVLPQQTVLQFAFRAHEVVMMGRNPHRGSSPAEDQGIVTEAMEQTDTLQLAHRLYPTLSGGEQARVSFARVLAQRTPVVLLDEPTGSLDLRHQELVMATLRRLADEGATIVAVLHDLNLAARYADRVGLMDRGHMVEVSATNDVLRPELLSAVYAHPVTVVPHPAADCLVVLPDGH
jgi:iron complex transport system ATP-binding protein